MHTNNCIPVAQRVDLASRMIVHQKKYGFVSQLSRESNISRQSLYTLKSRGQEAMERPTRVSIKGLDVYCKYIFFISIKAPSNSLWAVEALRVNAKALVLA